MLPQVVQRISMRWLPDEPFEDTDTVALYVGGYFIDLRVETLTQEIQWSQAGEHILLKENPPTWRWTHIIDSLGLTEPDEAYFKTLPNGDEVEIGTIPCPHKNDAMTDFEEVWRTITCNPSNASSWILQSQDGTTFLGRVGHIYLANRKDSRGIFSARKDIFSSTSHSWENIFKLDNVCALPSVGESIEGVEAAGRGLVEGDIVRVSNVNYEIKAFHAI